MDEVERRFHRAMISIYETAKDHVLRAEFAPLFTDADREQASGRRAPQRRVTLDALHQFCRYFCQKNGLVIGHGHPQFVHAASTSEMAQCRGVENEAGHSPVSNSRRSSSNDMASGSGRSASPTEWCSSSTVLAAASCPVR